MLARLAIVGATPRLAQLARRCAGSSAAGPWAQSMPESQFDLMRRILAAPSPVGLEASMTEGVIRPYLEPLIPSSWAFRRFVGSSSLVLDSQPEAGAMSVGDPRRPLTIMIVGHSDKIRMQVRSIAEDGKVYLDSDSFLPLTLIGNEVTLFSEDPTRPGQYRSLRGGTVEALGAIHFASPALRAGDKGVSKDQIYLELHTHGANRKAQVQALGIRPGDSVILDRPIRRGVWPDTFQGAYLDNGLGCFVTTEAARMAASNASSIERVRCLYTWAAFEEIGRFGSTVLASQLQPDVILAVDVNHDYASAPGVGDKRFAPLELGKGFTLAVGAVVSASLNSLIERVAQRDGIPMQRDVVGRDTGTDAMAACLGGVDAAVTSIGFPIRNMHTVRG